MTKKNDWIAINLNAPDTMSIDALYGYGITPDNTGLESEDFYKSQKQVVDTFRDKNTGKFDEERFHAFYESAQRSYNNYQKEDFTAKLLNDIESSPYDIFSLGDANIMDTSAIMYRSRDPQRTTMGLGNIYEVGSPTFDVREVAQANKARDENGNILDWSPNDRGGLFKGLFRPSMALATWDENGTHLENGIEVEHFAGDLKYDEKGDPYYEKLGNKEIYGKETLHYWDTITRDDSAWNKIDFMDSDGLTKSVAGTVMKTAVSLIPYFIPGVGEVFGYIGAATALGQTLPVLGKAIDGMLSNDTENGFYSSMTSVENIMDRFRNSQSRSTMGKFLSFENIGDIISSSAGQLFQQRQIGNLARKLASSKYVLNASKIGQRISIGYMAATSATDTYETFKEAGADERTAGIATLAYMTGLYGLMNMNYFKDMLFTNTWLDEDIAMRDTMRQLVKETTIAPFNAYAAAMEKPMTELQKRFARLKLYQSIKNKVGKTWTKWMEDLKVPRPTIHQLENAVDETGKKIGISAGMRASMYLSRALNEGIEETMEEGLTDVMKAITLGLDSLGINVTKDDTNLDFGLSFEDMMTRYMASFIGGAIGGAVFEGFNHWEGGPYDSLLEKSLVERLTWYERNGYDNEIRNRIDDLYKKGKLGNVNLSSKGTRIKALDGKGEIVVYGEGNASDNQNRFVYNVLNSYLDRLNSALTNNGLFTTDNAIFTKIWESVRSKHEDDSNDPEVQLYHFLEDLDTAKARTIEQMGFLNAVRDDANKLAYDIIRKQNEISKTKRDIIERNGITDSNRSEEEQLFKNNQYLKTLEKELNDMKKQWDQILNGERNGYYMGYATMMANGNYLDLYTNPNPSSEVFKNLQEVFPKTGIENWTKYTKGLDFNSITDEDLKKKIQDEYSSFISLEGHDRMRALYDMHIAFSEKFASDIADLNKKYEGRKAVNPAQYVAEFLAKYSDSIEHAVGKRAAVDLLNTFEKIEKSDLPNEAKAKRKTLNLIIALNETFPNVEGIDDTQIKLNFIKQLNQSITDDKAIADVQLIRNSIMRSIIDKDLSRIKAEIENGTGITASLNKLLSDLSSKLTESIDAANAFVDTLTDDEIEANPEFRNYIDNQYKSEDDLQSLGSAIDNYYQDKYKLLTIGPERAILYNKINDILEAIANNSSNLLDIYNDAIKYIEHNTPLSEEESKNLLDRTIFQDNINLVEFTLEQQQIERKNKANAIEELLKKFDIYTGGKIFNALKVIENEESFLNRLKRIDDYSITSKTIESELETALSFLRAISAIINSSIDGMNEQINLSRNENQLAVTNPALANLYSTQILNLVDRINFLLDTARANRLRTTKAQQDTMLNMNKLRVKALTGIGSIEFDGEVLDFEKEWEKTGFQLSKFELSNAKEADKAYRMFQSEISKRLSKIMQNYIQSNKAINFIDTIVKKLGEDVFRQNPGEFSDNEDNWSEKVTPYSNVNYLLTLACIDPSQFDSIWKTITGKNEDLIPISSQEYLVREAFASIVDFKEGYHIFDTLHQYIKDNFSISVYNKEYVDARGIAKRFINIDGIGGTGKTTGVDYLLDQCLKLYYDSVSSTACGATDTAANGVYNALRLGDDNVKPKVISDLINTVCKDKDGKLLFDLEHAIVKTNKTYTIKRDENNNIIDNAGRKLSSIPKENIDALFNSKDGLRILYVDESGLVNRPQFEFILELARLYNFFIVGSGDVLQNKATIAKDQNGIEDFVYHRTPPLTISMRSENNGKFRNIETLKTILRSANHQFFVDPSVPVNELNKVTQAAIEKAIGLDSSVKLIYSNSKMEGDQLIRSENVLDFSKKMLTFVKELANDGNKHQLAIVVDDEAKSNLYRNQFAEYGDSVVVISSKNVQGKEFDYVAIDKNFDSEKYVALTDFYTMITRAKIGSAIVDNEGIIKGLGIETISDDIASEPVLGSDPESRKAIFANYSSWWRELRNDIPDFVKTNPSITPASPINKNDGEDAFNTNGGNTGSKSEIQINGVEDSIAQTLKLKEERDAYYIQKLLNGESKHPYYQKLLKERSARQDSNNYIDFDIFVEELKDFDNNFFETHPLAITDGKSIVGTTAKLQYRAAISTIARAILNNSTANERIEFISSATNYLKDRLGGIISDPEGFLTDLKQSFNGDGFFVCNNGYIFYSFETNGKRVVIPISKYSNPNLNDSYFNNLEFNVNIGSIPVSTNGECFVSMIDALSEIDGVVTDKNNNMFVGVVTNTDDLKKNAKAFFKSRDDSGESKRTEAAYGYLQRNSGKSFIAVNTAASRIETGDKVFSAKYENGKPISATNKDYDPANLAQETALVGVQQITNIQDWFRAIGILHKCIRHKVDVDRSTDEPWIKNYFGGIDVLGQFNEVTNERQNIAANYKALGNLNILNRDAVNGLSSALFRYLNSNNVNDNFRMRFWQNFTKWLGNTKSNDDQKVHRKGFGITFKDSEGGVHLFSAVPKIDGNGYEIMYQNNISPVWETIVTDPNNKISTLFSGTNYDFVSAITNTFTGINNSATASNTIKEIVNAANSDLENYLKNGSVVVFPLDVYTLADSSQIEGYFSPFETDIYEWMVKDDSGNIADIEAGVLDNLSNFLKTDTIFKNNMYRDIKASHPDGTNISGWAQSHIKLDASNVYLDITKVIAPLYEIKTSLKSSVDEATKMQQKLGAFFALNTKESGAVLNVESMFPPQVNNSIVDFWNGGPIVNAEWVDNFSDGTLTEDTVEIKSIDLTTNKATLSNGETITLTLDGANQIFGLNGVKDVIDKYQIIDITGKYTILGNRIIEHLDAGDRNYDNIRLIGINKDIYSFETSSGIITMKLPNKLNNQKIEKRGIYLGSFEDTSIEGMSIPYYVYKTSTELVLYEINENEEPLRIPLEEITIADDSLNANDTIISNPSIVSAFKKEYNPKPDFSKASSTVVGDGIILVANSPKIDGSWIQSFTDDVIDNSIKYRILAYDENQIGVYHNDDLSTFKWISRNNIFDPSEIQVSNEESLVSSIDVTKIGLDWKNPAEVILTAIESLNNELKEKFSNLESEADTLIQYTWLNGEMSETKTSDLIVDNMSVKMKRAVYKYLKNNVIGEMNNVNFFREGSSENEITVEFEVNGNRRSDTFKVGKDLKSGSYEVRPLTPDKINTSSTIEQQFDNLMQNLQSLSNEIQRILSSEIIPVSEINVLQQELNTITPQINALQAVKDAVANSNINKNSLISKLRVLDGATKAIALQYYQANNKKNQC